MELSHKRTVSPGHLRKHEELRKLEDSWLRTGRANSICMLQTRNYGIQSLLKVEGNWVSEAKEAKAKACMDYL